MDNDVLEWVSRNYDIDDDAVDRGLPYSHDLPDRLKWMYWLPNGYLLHWKDYSPKERAIMISVGFHMNWKLMELQFDLDKLKSELE